MDNLTHALTGAALARTGLDRTTPLATATLVLAANAPDVDVLAYTQGPWFALAFRRGITHGVPALLVLPWLVAGAVLAWDRWIRRRRDPDAPPARPRAVLGLAFLGLLTHPALDWMNTYGMRWGLPFSGGWSYGDALFIIDPWLWLLLGGAVVMEGVGSRSAAAAWALLGAGATALVLTGPVPAPARVAWAVGLTALVTARVLRTSRARHAHAPPPHALRAGRALTAAAAAYVALMVVGDVQARAHVRAALAESEVGDVVDVMVGPAVADPTVGEVVVRTRNGYLQGEYRRLDTPRVRFRPEAWTPARAGDGLPLQIVSRAAAAAMEAPEARHYLVWSRYPYVRVSAEDGGYRVRIADARYDDRGVGSLAGLTVRLDAGFRPRSVEP